MNPSQKFEELSEVMGLACRWLDEIENQKDPFVLATWELLKSYQYMIEGNEKWEECFEVVDRIEKNHPEVVL